MISAAIDEERAQGLRKALAAELAEKGIIRSASWRKVFEKVPRHRFVDAVYRSTNMDGRVRYKVDDDWLKRVYSDDALVTQVDRTCEHATSSSTRPSLMASMLEALEVNESTDVLEIGTGTGYNAALLCERLGSHKVTTIDIHSDLVDAAAKRLDSLGYQPISDTADGHFGYPEAAPYDRIIATCSVRRIPPDWLKQTKLGGVIVANIGGEYGSGTACIRKCAGYAQGKFLPDDAAFISMEGEAESPRPPTQSLADLWINGRGPSRPVTLPEESTGRDGTFWFLAQLFLPNTVRFDGPRHPWCLVDHKDFSWARVSVADDGSATVTQGGPQCLWDLLEEAHDLWLQTKKPSWDRYGLTVRPDGSQRVWLDEPDSPHAWDI